jgi:hypothetical protein
LATARSGPLAASKSPTVLPIGMSPTA